MYLLKYKRSCTYKLCDGQTGRKQYVDKISTSLTDLMMMSDLCHRIDLLIIHLEYKTLKMAV
jgi:hypothetical protein